jgi:2-dehydropantoate 2-reductase
VVGSLAYFATDIAEPGVIHHTEGNKLSLGEPNSTRSERTKAIADALIAAGLRCPVTTRFRHEIWVKLLGNVAFNPISAVTGGTLEQLVRHAETAALVREIMSETEAVAGKLGSSCRSRSISAWRAPRRWAPTRPPCCRITRPAARWSSKPWSARRRTG